MERCYESGITNDKEKTGQVLKVLVASPVTKLKSYILWDFLVAIRSLDYGDYDIFLVDNSHFEKFHKQLPNCEYIEPGSNAPETITKCQNRIRDYFLEGDYDALLMVECDVIPPLDVIENLKMHEVPVIGLPYLTYRGEESKSVAWDLFADGNDRYPYDLDAVMEAKEDIRQVYQCGLGCMLIQRPVLEKIKFRCTNDMYSDSLFAEDCFRNNIPMYADMAYMADHVNV